MHLTHPSMPRNNAPGLLVILVMRSLAMCFTTDAAAAADAVAPTVSAVVVVVVVRPLQCYCLLPRLQHLA